MTATTKINLEAIPSELKLLPQWVCWRREVREGKPTKVPYRADGAGKASTTDPATWATFQDACNALARGGYNGIGFVFSPADVLFCGIDLDHCRDPQTGEIEDWARAIVDRLASYTEITPSGTGLHIIVKAKLPPGDRRKGSIEMYDSGRYFTITGHHLEGTPATIESRQEELGQLHAQVFPKAEPIGKPGGNGSHPPVDLADTELIAKAENAKNGAAFSALWRGDTSAYGGDDSAADLALCCHLAFRTGNDPARIDRLFRQSGLYREKWERADYRARTIAKAIEGTAETYTPEHARQPKEQTTKEYHLSDAGNALYFTDQHGDRLRYDHRRGAWFEWCRHYWREDTDGQVMRLALRASQDRYKDSVSIPDHEAREKLAKWLIGNEARARLEATIAIAKSLLPIADSGENWDVDPWLFCVKNGVIDLRTGELRDGKPEDMIRLQSPVTYDPQARAPRWLRFLDEVFDGQAELIDWLQRYAGYSLTGDTREQVVVICYGRGANGKTRLLAILRHVLGAYGYDAPFTTFELTERSSIPNDVAALVNKRLVTSSETNEGTRLNEARIKALSGGDSITARFLRAEFFTFQPAAKYWLSVNHRPRVQDDSFGFWRRVRLVPFNRQFAGEADDKLLGEKLISEAPGILNWMLAGCLAWQKRGLSDTPVSIQQATSEYQTESDPLSQFILDQCVISPQATVKASQLYKEYLAWCDDQGLRERERLTNNAFGRRMTQKNYKKCHNRDGTFYQGLGTKCDGFVTDSVPAIQKDQLSSLCKPRMGNKKENTSQSVNPSGTPPSEDTPDYAAVLGMPIDQALTIWRAEGAPVIFLGDGFTEHLDRVLSQPEVSERHLIAIKAWLSEHQPKEGGSDDGHGSTAGTN